jgi:hypothetical protein
VFEDKRENADGLTGARRLDNALQEENGAPILLQVAHVADELFQKSIDDGSYLRFGVGPRGELSAEGDTKEILHRFVPKPGSIGHWLFGWRRASAAGIGESLNASSGSKKTHIDECSTVDVNGQLSEPRRGLTEFVLIPETFFCQRR